MTKIITTIAFFISLVSAQGQFEQEWEKHSNYGAKEKHRSFGFIRRIAAAEKQVGY
jgi:hypothetical protein